MSGPIYIFAGGGTGGHIYPGLAVAEALTGRRPEARVVFACSYRDLDRRILDSTSHGVVPQPVRPLPRRPGDVPAFASAWARSRRLARDMVRDLRPAAVLGLGGFAAAPLVRQAARVGVSTALLNPDAVPGKANRYLARRVEVIFTQFDSTTPAIAAPLRHKVRRTGCPMRSRLINGSRSEALAAFDLREDRRTLLVLGGSTGARTINEAFAAFRPAMADLADKWQALHVTGRDRAGVAPPDEDAGGPRVRETLYCDRMDLAYAVADLALCRGGAVTVAELSAVGLPAVVMPYPYHRDQHQKRNAAALAEAGAAVVCHDAADAAANARALADCVLPILRDETRLESMRRAAAARSDTDAASAVADWLAGKAG